MVARHIHESQRTDITQFLFRSGSEQQLRRELATRGLPEPEALERLDELRIGAKATRPVHFRRFRSDRERGLQQPDRHGSFWEITFPAPVRSPLAFGFACHFGLGLFRPLAG